MPYIYGELTKSDDDGIIGLFRLSLLLQKQRKSLLDTIHQGLIVGFAGMGVTA